MGFDYFYGEQSEQFTFYRVPKLLFTNPCFKSISTDSKILYGLMLDRMSLSQKNGWFDEKNRVYIIFTIESVMETLGCGKNKACQLLAELEEKAGLITRKRQGLGKPSLIYVKNFFSVVDNSDGVNFLKFEKQTSGGLENKPLEVPKSNSNNTDSNNNEFSNNNLFSSSDGEWKGNEGSEEYRIYYDYFYEKLEYDILRQDRHLDDELLMEILDLIVDTVCTKRKFIRIASDDKPAEVVKSKFMKLDASHIQYALETLGKNTTKVYNIRQYLLATIYNAPSTMSAYYDAEVRNHNPHWFNK